MWQQWALVKLEHKLRFQEGHHYHFETFDIPEYARTLWFQWLLDPRNKDFAAHASDPRIKASQNDLFDHMMKPFYILDDIRRNDGWDFSCGFSIYSYLSIFGTGIYKPKRTSSKRHKIFVIFAFKRNNVSDCSTR